MINVLQIESAEVSRTNFVNAMAALPAPVVIITSGSGPDRVGMTASAVCSLSADPPSVVVCINKSASAYQAITTARKFGFNVVAPQQSRVAEAFSRKNVDRFANGVWHQSSNGVPLLDGAPIALGCHIDEVVDGFTHSILIGRVQCHSGQDHLPINEALVWFNRGFRTVRSADE